jgi:hypothetical protein
MNDFTKEELKDMADGLSVMWGEYVGVSEQDDLDRWHALRDRLVSLIDNYCNHIWTDGSGNHIFCDKCQAYRGKR